MGVEVRCNAEYVRLGLRRELIALRNGLANTLNESASTQVRLVPEPPVEPFICTAVPSAVNLSLAQERRTPIDIYGFNLRAKPITVSLITAGAFHPEIRDLPFATFQADLRGAVIQRGTENIATPSFHVLSPATRVEREVSNALSIVSDFHTGLDLTASGFDLLPNSLEVALSWNGLVQSEIAVLSNQKLAKCSVLSQVWNVAGTESQTFKPEPVTANLHGKTPDQDFHGNGPCVTFGLNLGIDSARKHLLATYSMDAWECDGDFTKILSDYTEAVGSGSLVLFAAKDNEKILSFDVDSSLSHKYFDTTVGKDDRFAFAGTAPVTSLVYVGDTDGSEAGSRTSVTMNFRPIRFQIESCEGGAASTSSASPTSPSGPTGCGGLECGSDGLGGSCGTCPWPRQCNGGHCTVPVDCKPDCRGKQCGSDGCQGSCGTCLPGSFCKFEGQCLRPGQYPK